MKRHLPLFFAVAFALLAGAYTQARAQDDSAAAANAATSAESAEAQLFSMFENTCMAFAGDSTALKAWADLNMRSIPPNADDKAFAAFVGRWATDIGGRQVQLSLIDTIWACNITAPDMDGPQIQKSMKALHDKLDAGGHYDVRLEDQSDPAHPDMQNTLVEATLAKTESLLFRVNTASGGKGPARLILFKGNLGLIDEARANQTANQAANDDSSKDTGGSGNSSGESEDTKPKIDRDKLAAVLGAQLKVAIQYKADEKDNNITTTAVKMFADGCVAHFGDGKGLASWASARMTPNRDSDPYSKATGTSPAGSWSTDIGENANVLLNFNNVPVQCLLVASRSYADVTHNEMKLLTDRLNSEGKYKAEYRGGIVNPQTGTLYSMIMLQPAGGGPALQIVASTNTKQGTKSVFSIGYAGK